MTVDRNHMSWVGVAGLLVGFVLASIWAWVDLRRQHRSQARLNVALGRLDATQGSTMLSSSLLAAACELHRAERAELVLFRRSVAWRLRHVHGENARGEGERQRAGGWGSRGEGEWEPVDDDAVAGLRAEVADGISVRRLNPGGPFGSAARSAARSALLPDGVQAAMLAPVRGRRISGSLLVADPIGRRARFSAREAARFGLFANQAGVLLDSNLHAEELGNRMEARQRAAARDQLTGLPTRELFVERVDRAAALATTNLMSAVLLVNLDRFREMNAAFGHHVGDRLLAEVGVRLRDELPVTATVARLGGDEFAVLLCEVPDLYTARRLARELLATLQRPYVVDGVPLQLDASVGVALAPVHASGAVELLQSSDVAMESAKRHRSGVEIYDRTGDQRSPEQLTLLFELREALEHHGLSLVYQPKADLRTQRTRGVEALARWHHPERGTIPPGEFIPMAERTGLVHLLTRWVLRTVARQQQQWRQRGMDIEVAVNLSARNLLDLSLPGDIALLLREYDLPAQRLRLEITESSVIVDPGRAARVLAELSRMGVGLSVDDFGTGYSSLTHVLRLPVDEIKVDRIFVSELVSCGHEAAIVQAAIDLGRRLAKTVTAEGVEDLETWAALTELGCDLAQGFWLARPMDAALLESWLEAREQHSVAMPESA